jgi:CheY-like chemotaxis protein
MTDTSVRVLIVDDSPEDRIAFRRYLERCSEPGYSIAEAESGEDGLSLCRSQLPQCILLDYNLPDVDGVEFLSRLHAELNGDTPAVVILTGMGDETLAVRCMKAGAQDYLVKGISLDRVSPAICGAIESVELRRRVEAQALEVQTLSEERAALITELKSRATALADADRRKDEFLATLAHELRNPLAPIRTAMQILKRGNPKQSTVTELSGATSFHFFLSFTFILLTYNGQDSSKEQSQIENYQAPHLQTERVESGGVCITVKTEHHCTGNGCQESASRKTCN